MRTLWRSRTSWRRRTVQTLAKWRSSDCTHDHVSNTVLKHYVWCNIPKHARFVHTSVGHPSFPIWHVLHPSFHCRHPIGTGASVLGQLSASRHSPPMSGKTDWTQTSSRPQHVLNSSAMTSPARHWRCSGQFSHTLAHFPICNAEVRPTRSRLVWSKSVPRSQSLRQLASHAHSKSQ